MILLTTPASIDSLCNVCVQAEHNFLSVSICCVLHVHAFGTWNCRYMSQDNTPPPLSPPFLIPPMMWSVNWPWYVYVYIFINRVSSFFGLRSLPMIVKLLWNSLLDALYWANQIDGPIPNLENKQKSALNRTFLGFFSTSEKLRFVSTEYFFFIYTVFQMVLSCWSKGIHYYLLG